MADFSDRRAHERLAVNRGSECSFVSPVVEDFGTAKLRDVSLDGVGLLIAKRVNVGSLLSVVLANPEKGFTKTVFVRVAHVTAVTGGFLVGGSFEAPLTYQELTTLVM
jgi:hypothetical protein